MMKKIFVLLFAGAGLFAQAQQNKITSDPYQEFLKAKQFFEQGSYGLAYPIFKNIEGSFTGSKAINQQHYNHEVTFYKLACALMNRELGVEDKAAEFIRLNGSDPLAGMLSYYLGDYYFYQKKYTDATAAFEATAIDNLSNKEISNMKFEQGYSYFTQQQFKQAKPLLDAVRQIPDDPHYVDANYYYGLISFADRNYRQALQSFEIAKNDPQYGSVVPYYTASINYLLGDKEKSLEEAEAALQKGGQFYSTQLKQLAGHGFFEKKQYAKALPYLEQYVKESEKVRREELYELGYSYYQTGNLNKTIETFRPMAGGKDSLSQHAMYLLGDAYLKTGQKANARNAFLFCSTNSSNPEQKEISLFNYGKLSYELGYDNEALNALQTYVQTYPKSSYITEAKDVLVNALANTSNYKEALDLYESTVGQSENTKRQYPKILYNRAQELINDGRVAEADKLLDKAIRAPYNQEVSAVINFWKGELAFRKGDYENAAKYLQDYLAKPVINGEANTDNARYDLGYAYLRMENYKAAQKEFEALQSKRLGSTLQEQDVALRTADAYYMQKDFNKAKQLYSNVVAARGAAADYAVYQTGMIAGAQNKASDKIATLRSIETTYPSSSLAGQANMEIANTYLSNEQFRDAIPYLTKIISNKNAESLKPEAYLKAGIAHYNLDNNNEALNNFKTLLNKYPQSPESEDAIDNIRSIFIEQGKADEYIAFIKSTGRTVDYGQADSLTYASIEIQLSDGKKDQALPALKNYLQKYPDGKYFIQASYNTAVLSRDKNDFKTAATNFEAVAAKAPNKYAEASILGAARIYYFEDKDYAKAASYYGQLKNYASTQENKLEAMRGLVRSQYNLKQYAEATGNANDLLKERGAGSDDKTFAYLVLAKNAQQEGNLNEAINQYKQVAALSKAEAGAEARYEIAVCLFQQNKLADAEKSAFDMIKKSGSYELWVTKSYLLLGDIYFKQKDYFNAKATFKSVAENATIKELKAEAEEKLVQAEAAEAGNSKMRGE